MENSPIHPALTQAARKLEALSAEQFELYLENRTSTKIESKEQKIDSMSRAQDVGLAIRVVRDHRMGFSFTTSLDHDSVVRAAEGAFEMAAHMPPDPHVALAPFRPERYPELRNRDEKGAALPPAEKVARAKRLEALTRAADPRIAGIRSASLSEHLIETQMMDSEGTHLSHRMSLFTTAVSCKAEASGDSQMGSDFDYSNFLDQLDIEAVAKRAARRATELLGAGSCETMRCPAIFRNHVVAELLEFLSSSFSAEQIDKRRSMLAGKQGQKLFSDRVTLMDDGLLPGGYGTSPFDGEGVPCRRNTLVERGVFAGALYDVYHARKFGTEATGSSGRGIKSPPSIGISNLIMEKGVSSFDQLIGSVSRGVLITNLMGVHTANPVTGDFSLGASGILIENGKLTRPVRGFAVAGNVLGLFREMDEIGSDLRSFGSVSAPSVRVKELSVGGA